LFDLKRTFRVRGKITLFSVIVSLIFASLFMWILFVENKVAQASDFLLNDTYEKKVTYQMSDESMILLFDDTQFFTMPTDYSYQWYFKTVTVELHTKIFESSTLYEARCLKYISDDLDMYMPLYLNISKHRRLDFIKEQRIYISSAM